jgi:hypothetical protein
MTRNMRTRQFRIRAAGGGARPMATLLLAMAMALAGCAGKSQPPREKIARALQEMSWEVDRQVVDAQRAGRLQQAIDGLDADLGELQEVSETLRSSLRALNANPDATRAEFDRLLDGFDADRRRLRDRVLRHHLELLAATSADEWARLSRHERDALAAVTLR